MVTKVEMFSDLSRIMRRGISWFIQNADHPININNTITEFRKEVEELTAIISKLLVGATKTKFFNKIEHYTNAGIDKKLAKSIATLEVLVSAFDIIHIAKQTKTENEDIANIYFETGDIFNIDWLRQASEAQINESYWNRLSVQSLKDDFYDKQRRLISIIVSSDRKNINLKSWLQKNSSAASIFVEFVEDIKMQKAINLNMIILANKKFEIFLRKIG
jgi:glutamate dehydrogenase